MPVIPALWDTKAGGLLEARSSILAWPTWQNPDSTNTQKLAGCGETQLSYQVLRRLRQENYLHPGGRGSSELLRSCHCTPAWATRVKLCLKKKVYFCHPVHNILRNDP